MVFYRNINSFSKCLHIILIYLRLYMLKSAIKTVHVFCYCVPLATHFLFINSQLKIILNSKEYIIK